MHDALRVTGFILGLALIWRLFDVLRSIRLVRSLRTVEARPGEGSPASLLFVRHGESIVNAKGILRSLFDSYTRPLLSRKFNHETPLTAIGEKQAEDLGARLRSEYGVPDYIYHSNYRRAKDTAARILACYTPEERQHIKVVESELIRERYVSENIYEIIGRLDAFLGQVGRESGRKNVIIVTHDRVIRSARFFFDYVATGHVSLRDLLERNDNCAAVFYAAKEGVYQQGASSLEAGN